MISKQQREELSALHATATYDEWRADDTYVYMPTGESKLTIAYVSYPIAAKLIVVMQNVLPRLLADLYEKDAEIERLSVALRLAQARAEDAEHRAKALFEAADFKWERDRWKARCEALEDVYLVAKGLCQGEDWNNGTHAKLHGYRQKLIDAVKAVDQARFEGGGT